RYLREVECGLARGVAAEPGRTLDDVSRVTDFAEFAVADTRDAGLDLLAHAFVHRGLHDPVELRVGVSFALVAGQQQRDKLGTAGETSDMSGVDHKMRRAFDGEIEPFIYASSPQARSDEGGAVHYRGPRSQV